MFPEELTRVFHKFPSLATHHKFDSKFPFSFHEFSFFLFYLRNTGEMQFRSHVLHKIPLYILYTSTNIPNMFESCQLFPHLEPTWALSWHHWLNFNLTSEYYSVKPSKLEPTGQSYLSLSLEKKVSIYKVSHYQTWNKEVSNIVFLFFVVVLQKMGRNAFWIA